MGNEYILKLKLFPPLKTVHNSDTNQLPSFCNYSQNGSTISTEWWQSLAIKDSHFDMVKL